MALPTVSASEVQMYSPDPLDGFPDGYIEKQAQAAVLYLQTRWGAVIERRLDSGKLPLDLYKFTVANAVLRVARNPHGYTMEQSGSYQYQQRATVASGFIWFTDEDVNTLVGVSRSGRLPGTISVGIHGAR